MSEPQEITFISRAEATAQPTFELPDFIPEDPERWFAILECRFATAGITTQVDKYSYLAANLPFALAVKVRDIIIHRPANHPYDVLRGALMERAAASQESRIRQLLEGLQLGDNRPSQLLHQMRALAGSSAGLYESLLRQLWLRKLPTSIQPFSSILLDKLPLIKVAEMADTAVDTLLPGRYQVTHERALTTSSTISDNNHTRTLWPQVRGQYTEHNTPMQTPSNGFHSQSGTLASRPEIASTPLPSTASITSYHKASVPTTSVPLKVNTNSLSSSAKPFTRAIAPEPVATVVTIPDSSRTSGIKTAALEEKRSNNGVNNGTRNALLNTPLAAWHSMPGGHSHSTVTSTVAATGVTGHTEPETISAATIILQVGTTRQTTANIQEVVLPTPNNLPSFTSQNLCSNHITTTNSTKPSEQEYPADNQTSTAQSIPATSTSVISGTTEPVAQLTFVPNDFSQSPVHNVTLTITSSIAETLVDSSTANAQAVANKSAMRTTCSLTKAVLPNASETPSTGPTVSEPFAPCVQLVKRISTPNSSQQVLNSPLIRQTAHDGIHLPANIMRHITAFPLDVYIFWYKSHIKYKKRDQTTQETRATRTFALLFQRLCTVFFNPPDTDSFFRLCTHAFVP
ncbi:unnamed protein product [Calicophoron daubneyi]|uniref:DUF7041 domain-containing protein n=1 Tax=Calicophoron daubneyi TaxID=300641 RepID=A0AAV2TCV9_CALDB